eukprot:823290-Pelagomonas_calceolata.AAC.2
MEALNDKGDNWQSIEAGAADKDACDNLSHLHLKQQCAPLMHAHIESSVHQLLHEVVKANVPISALTAPHWYPSHPTLNAMYTSWMRCTPATA